MISLYADEGFGGPFRFPTWSYPSTVSDLLATRATPYASLTCIGTSSMHTPSPGRQARKHAHTQAGMHAGKHARRQARRQAYAGTQAGTHAGRHARKHTHTQAGTGAGRAGRHARRQVHRQCRHAGRQVHRQAYTHPGRHAAVRGPGNNTTSPT